MSMSKKDFIALADAVKWLSAGDPLSPNQLYVLADFCKQQNPRFNRERWLSYIAGECGPNGGAIRNTPKTRAKQLREHRANVLEAALEGGHVVIARCV